MRSRKPKAATKKALSNPANVEELKAKISKSYWRIFKGNLGNVDDCIGFVLSKFLTNPNQLVDHAVIDYGRDEGRIYSRKGSNPDIAKARAQLYFAQEFDPRLHDGPVKLDQDKKIMLTQVADSIRDNRDRICFLLYWKWGFTVEEIGEVVNVTGARVASLLRAVMNRIVSVHGGTKMTRLGRFQSGKVSPLACSSARAGGGNRRANKSTGRSQ